LSITHKTLTLLLLLLLLLLLPPLPSFDACRP
jgi:hypothetical protein